MQTKKPLEKKERKELIMFKKNIKPVLLAGALALATAISPVMAADISNSYDPNAANNKYDTVQKDGEEIKTNISGDTVNIKKTLSFDNNLKNLNEQLSFNFTVNHNTSSGANDTEKGTGTAPVVKVNNVETNTGTITFTDLATSPSALAFKFEPTTGTTPGNYYYTLTETPGTQNGTAQTGVTYSETTYTIIVQVQNSNTEAPGSVKVDHLVIINNITNRKGNAEFTNIYNENAILEVEKQVKGTGAHADSFDFVIDLTLPENFAKTLKTDTYTCTIGKSVSTGSQKNPNDQVKFNYVQVTFTKHEDSTSGDAVRVTYDAQLTGQLADDGIVTIEGLPVGTTYKVSEKDTDYTETATSNTKAGDNVARDETITVDDKSVKYWYVDGIIIDSVDKTNINHVTFTNTKDSTPLTGVIINNMPYIALLGASGAGLVV
ncbi:DUF7601 domain-containing protein, partial [Floccifex sp.]|uniref:DUF7601 domain-containing protein n=1 Tax=Floccifex sp. TaxID=2815810 RepID=UPI003F00DF2F